MLSPDCVICRGACCETMIIPTGLLTKDETYWLGLHLPDGRCSALTTDGRCGIHDDRPVVCRLYPIGNSDCLKMIETRRTPEERARILGG